MRDVLIGQTDYSIVVGIFGTDGAPETGLAYTDIDIDYTRVETDNDVTYSDVSPATLANLTAAHSDWGFIEIGQGLYRLDIADAVFAAGAWEAVVTVSDASGTDFQPVHVGFRLVGYNPQTGIVGPRTWFVRTTGSDTNVGTQSSPLLTIAAAISAASKGDTIDIGPGTFTESIDVQTTPKPLKFRGAGQAQTTITSTTTTVKLGDDCTLEDLQVTTDNSVSTNQAVNAAGRRNIKIRRCILDGYFDGLIITSAQGFEIEDTTIYGDYDAVNCADYSSGIFRRCWLQCDSSYAGDNVETRALHAGGRCRVTLENCYLFISRTNPPVGGVEAIGLRAGENVKLINTTIEVYGGSDVTTDVICIRTDYAVDRSQVIMEGVWMLGSHDGSGSFKQIETEANGFVYDLVSNLNTAQATGNIKKLPIDIRQVAGETASASGTVNFSNLDASVASRLPTASYTAPPSAGTIADAVADEALSGHTTAGTVGAALGNIGTSTTNAAAFWSYSGGRTLSVESSAVSGTQQVTVKTIVRGSSYSATARPLLIVKQTGADWPSDLGDWSWTLKADKAASNGGTGSQEFTGTVTPTTETGDAQEFRISLTAAVTAALAPGEYTFAIRGTGGASGTEIYDAVVGKFFVLDSPAATTLS